MKRCPNGYHRVGNKCVKNKSLVNEKKSKKTSSTVGTVRQATQEDRQRMRETYERQKEDNLSSKDPYKEFNEIGRAIEWLWSNRPEMEYPVFWNLPGFVAETAEEFIDKQMKVARDIVDGKYKDEDLYTPTERERVQSLGFKPVWTPGGIQA